MQCPACGKTDLHPEFKFCPQCSSPLTRASNVPKEEDAGRTEQPGPPGNNNEFELGTKELQGIDQQKAPKETEQGQSVTSQAHGATQKLFADHCPAVEQGGRPTKSNQHFEDSTTPTPSQSAQVEATVVSKLTTVQKEPNTTPSANGVKAESTSEGKESSFSKEIHSGGNELSTPSTVVASSPSHTTAVREVRGPAELDESSPQYPTPQKPPASQALSVINEQKQANKGKVVGEKKLTESRQGSLNDPTATHTSGNGSSIDNASPPKEPQQNERESHGHSGSASQNREDNQVAEGSFEVSAGPVTRQAAKRNQQSAAPSSSPTPGTTEPTTRHPLEGQGNDGNGAEAKEMTMNFESEKKTITNYNYTTQTLII